MKNHPILLLTAFATFSFSACEVKMETKSNESTETTITYDSLLAQGLGADEYGMHRYVMAFLKAGPNRGQDSATAAQIQAGHIAHINQLAESGKLVLAGPFLDGGKLRGIFIFDASLEEAQALTAQDPAVISGRLTMELLPWYGSAAVMQINEIHKKLSKSNP